MEYYDLTEGRGLTEEDFWDDETPEDIEYYIDLKIHQVIKEIHAQTSYEDVKDTILDSELYFSENFYNDLLSSNCTDEELYQLILQENTEKPNEY